MRNSKKTYHFIGIGGIGMSALAHILLDRKIAVTGSDLSCGVNVHRLIRKGCVYHQGHSRENIPDQSVVVYGSGIPGSNIEYLEAIQRKLPLIHRSELLASLMEGMESILVSGSHGKTTTSSLLATIFSAAGRDPSFAIGGLNKDLANGRAGGSKYFIAEADESDGTLRRYQPQAVIVTNLDKEHLVNYDGSIDRLGETFQQFITKVSNAEKIVYCGDCPILSHYHSKELHSSGISYGFGEKNDARITAYESLGWSSTFSFSFRGKEFQNVTVALPGKHNVLNAMAAILMSLSYGIEERVIREVLSVFGGVKRRLERKESSEKILLLDDYAHHPKEIQCSLQAVRHAVGERRVIAVCQPHRFSRIFDCIDEYKGAFEHADIVVFTDIYGAGEDPIEGISSEVLVKNINNNSNGKALCVTRSEVVDFLKKILLPHDVCISLGAGDITKIHDELRSYNPRKLVVGLLCGGMSQEHSISLLSAKNVFRHLDKNWYQVLPIAINKKGLWTVGDSQKFFKEKEIANDQGETIFSLEVIKTLERCDVFFPVLHGPNGEDGTIQGFIETLGKPYVGPNMVFSSICMDKVLTKQLAQKAGVSVVPYQQYHKGQWLKDPDSVVKEIASKFFFPLFVKAVHLGSSIGVYEVFSLEDLSHKLNAIFNYDSVACVEEKICEGREIEFSCLGDPNSPFFFVADPVERAFGGCFIDYETKYSLNGRAGAKNIFEGVCSEELIKEGKALAKKVCEAVRGSGLCRIDFFLTKENKFLFSEVNTIPGMTPASTFPGALARHNLNLQKICHRLIAESIHRKQVAQNRKV